MPPLFLYSKMGARLALRMAKMKIRPLFAWYDLWMGAYWDRKSRKLYILPLPCIGIVIEWN